MKFTFLRINIIKLLCQRHYLALLVGVLALSTLLLSLIVCRKREQVILVPPQITKALKIQGNEVSREYLEEVGVYMAKLLLDLSPASFPYNHQLLLKYTAPTSYGDLKKRFLKEGEQYKKLQLSTHFFPSQVTADSHRLKVEVLGTLTSFVAGRQVQSAQEKIVFEFIHSGGGLLIKQITGGSTHEVDS